MTITIRQKALANDNISLYLDIYDGGKRKFEFLSDRKSTRLNSSH